jgi:hypothetical protein
MALVSSANMVIDEVFSIGLRSFILHYAAADMPYEMSTRKNSGISNT